MHKKYNTLEVFWSRVNKQSSNDCWLWTGLIAPTGYGRFYADGKEIGAHRYSWKNYNGDIPTGMFVCHKCDNKPCVNPNHLFLGTPQDNTTDMVNKGRVSYRNRGEGHALAKLTDSQVIEMRSLYKPKVFTVKMIAELFNKPIPTVNRIIHRQSWKHI